MNSTYGINGLIFWDEEEVQRRRDVLSFFDRNMRRIIRDINPAVDIRECETPTMIPRSLLNTQYTDDDVWVLPDQFALRAETTPGSYLYARHLFDSQVSKPPLCVFQAGKSYRREDEHPQKFVRLKEFWQAEWQWVYTTDTGADYHSLILSPVMRMISDVVGLPTRLVPSDRLPSYSLITMDVEVAVDDRWMEVASISKRNDFPGTYIFSSAKGATEKNLLNVEVAIGLDRCVYCIKRRCEDAVGGSNS